jgi:geranylgeranyl pyrophosphate synthase
MKLSLMDEQAVRAFAQANAALVESVISSEAEKVHDEDNFFGEIFQVAMFLAFVKTLANLVDGAVTITKIISNAEKLFQWVRKKTAAADEATPAKATLAERILVLLFDVYVNQKKGVREETLPLLLSAEPEEVTKALESLQAHGVIRKAKNGSWKYVRPA